MVAGRACFRRELRPTVDEVTDQPADILEPVQNLREIAFRAEQRNLELADL
jgi:hypothetical protein